MKLLLPIVCSLLLIGCSDSTTTESPAASQNEVQASTAPDTKVPEANESTEVQTPVQASVEAPKESPAPAVVAETPKAEKAAVPAPAPKPAPAAKPAAINAGAIFAQKCASCHGANAEKSALGKSQIIADFSEQQIKDALHGYQEGTYGKEMKALMQGQAKPLSSEQIDALAHYISAL